MAAMAAIAAITVTVHRKLSRVWPRVEFPSDFLNEGLVARNLIDCAMTACRMTAFPNAAMKAFPNAAIVRDGVSQSRRVAEHRTNTLIRLLVRQQDTPHKLDFWIALHDMLYNELDAVHGL